jgi:hypothetical protein
MQHDIDKNQPIDAKDDLEIQIVAHEDDIYKLDKSEEQLKDIFDEKIQKKPRDYFDAQLRQVSRDYLKKIQEREKGNKALASERFQEKLDIIRGMIDLFKEGHKMKEVLEEEYDKAINACEFADFQVEQKVLQILRDLNSLTFVLRHLVVNFSNQEKLFTPRLGAIPSAALKIQFMSPQQQSANGTSAPTAEELAIITQKCDQIGKKCIAFEMRAEELEKRLDEAGKMIDVIMKAMKDAKLTD